MLFSDDALKSIQPDCGMKELDWGGAVRQLQDAKCLSCCSQPSRFVKPRLSVSTDLSPWPFEDGWYGGEGKSSVPFGEQKSLNFAHVSCVPLPATKVSSIPS